MARTKLDLEWLLSPVGAREFFSDHWEKQPLHVRPGAPGRFDSLLADVDLGEIVSEAARADGVLAEVIGGPGGDSYAGRVLAEAGEVMAAYGRGATVRIRAAQRCLPPLLTLTRGLEQTLGCPVSINLYATPAGQKGVRRHYDCHDVFLLQVAGRKHWRLYHPVVRLPLEQVPPLPFEERAEGMKYARGGPKKGRGEVGDDDTGPPAREMTLETRDLLYMPRGFVHEAETSDRPSVHLTVGLYVLTWLDLFTVALGQLAQADERFRKSLPLGLLEGRALSDSARDDFKTLLEVFSERAELRNALTETAESLVRRRALADDSPAATQDASSEINLDTRLERRPRELFRLLEEGPVVGLASAGSVLWLPASFREALRFVALEDSFAAGEIPGQLSESSRLSLARRLVRDGFLRAADGG